jgi:hypothetical protein
VGLATLAHEYRKQSEVDSSSVFGSGIARIIVARKIVFVFDEVPDEGSIADSQSEKRRRRRSSFLGKTVCVRLCTIRYDRRRNWRGIARTLDTAANNTKLDGSGIGAEEKRAPFNWIRYLVAPGF